METIETQTTSQINFDKNEVRGEIYSVSTYVFGLPRATQIGLECEEKTSQELREHLMGCQGVIMFLLIK